ncbi:MAG: PspC domain-containing protein [Solirubrobacterales bacterium]|jgi:phage shock protein PspC (stress-responsive transcriptional regulator)
MANQPKKDKKTEKDETKVGPRRPLLRSRDDRMLWGVAGGLADHLGFNATLVRVAFVVITLFGGAGLLAYLVLAVALPEDDGTGQPVDESVWARLGKVVLVCILVAIALVLAAGIAAVSAWITATGHGTVVAVAVIALGFALVAAAFATDVRRRLTPPLVVLALVLGIPAGAVAAADIKFDNSVGQRTYTPTVAADIPADGYKLGTGQLVVDLRQLPWAPGQTIAASAHLGIGQMIVSVPSSVCVVGHTTAKAGDLVVAGDVSNGVDPEVDQGTPTSKAPRLDLDADIQLGQLIVTDEAPDEIDTHGVDYDHHQQEADAQRQVCGR